ncbi:MAG: ABC transporter ATP-binding protein [Oscillospiraceae bacterium]|nr:ABC transporter ATP-binding protein [Oscillospiraceae bacterium]
MNEPQILLDVQGLRVSFQTPRGSVQAVSDANFQVRRGEVTGIAGESGSGKSVSAYAVLGLLARNASVEGGSAFFNGRDLLSLEEKELRKIRGSEISMIFQDPVTALDPAFTIGSFLAEVLRSHEPSISRREARRRSAQMLAAMGIPDPENVMSRYPDSLSGGMCQRVCIAAALLCTPKLLIADEPTTALDVTIQDEILSLLQQIKEEKDMSILFISHDFGVLARLCDRICVMYGGFVMESGSADQIYHSAAHPYTQALMRAIPRLENSAQEPLPSLRGEPLDPVRLPDGCVFASCCPQCSEECLRVRPVSTDLGEDHTAACHKLIRKRKKPLKTADSML